jgi:hypothetical protein
MCLSRIAHQRVAVVGNGPIRASDELALRNATFVVRFNDAKTWSEGDRIDLRVVRLPTGTWATRGMLGVPTWYVSPTPIAHACSTAVYESQYGAANVLEAAHARLFPRCDCASCWHNLTFAGPSTGAAFLSLLEETWAVRRVDVYGMNWQGDPRVHVDFRARDLVPRCCTKCRIHPTASRRYLPSSRASLLRWAGVVFEGPSVEHPSFLR